MHFIFTKQTMAVFVKINQKENHKNGFTNMPNNLLRFPDRYNGNVSSLKNMNDPSEKVLHIFDS